MRSGTISSGGDSVSRATRCAIASRSSSLPSASRTGKRSRVPRKKRSSSASLLLPTVSERNRVSRTAKSDFIVPRIAE